jgi:hypothetical protein
MLNIEKKKKIVEHIRRRRIMEDLLDKDEERERKGVRRKGGEWKTYWIRMAEDGKGRAGQEQRLENLLYKDGGRW